jgi:hypothetical protein
MQREGIWLYAPHSPSGQAANRGVRDDGIVTSCLTGKP